jgi:hypothetical protein
VHEFLAAKNYAERRLARLELSWTILRFRQLTDHPGNGRIDTVMRAGAPLTTSRDVAALTRALRHSALHPRGGRYEAKAARLVGQLQRPPSIPCDLTWANGERRAEPPRREDGTPNL